MWLEYLEIACDSSCSSQPHRLVRDVGQSLLRALLMKVEENEPLAGGCGDNDEEPSVALSPDLLSPESSARRDDAPLLQATVQIPGVLEIAVESFDEYVALSSVALVA